MKKLHLVVFGALLVFLFVGIAGAVYPNQVSMVSSNEWPVANGVDSSLISVTASNTTTGVVPGLTVEFSLNRTDLGTITPSTTTTGADGVARSLFTSSTKSGTVLITAKIYYKYNDADVNENLKNTSRGLDQKIDHDTPFNLYKIAPDINQSEVNVGSTVQLIYQLKDKYGNNIDQRKQPITNSEKIRFVINNKPNAAFSGTWMGTPYSGQDVILQVNQTGFIVVNLITDSIPGLNTVHIIPQSTIPDSSFDIRGEAKGEPYNITQSVYLNHETIPLIINPADPPRLAADGISQFTFIYNITDRYGNGIIGAPVRINVTIAGEITKLTDNHGEVIVYIGPTDSIGPVNVSAYTTNASVKKVNQTVWFMSTEPVDMQLTADPQSMPSRDVQPTYTSRIIAKVVDDSGNPVQGEDVHFSLSQITYDETYHVNASPQLESNYAQTNDEGEAIVLFDPGKFTLDGTDKNPLHPYDPTATGRCYVNATWNVTTNRSIALAWKNYPYISVYTDVQPKLVNVSDTVDVTLTLKGDGYALQPPPVDVVMVTDLSGSMNSGSPTKLTGAKNALKRFVGNAGNKIFIGLASYGNGPVLANAQTKALYALQNATTAPFNPYGTFYNKSKTNPDNYNQATYGNNGYSDAKIDKNFTQVKNELNTTINAYSGNGGTNIAGGINAALLMFKNKGVLGHNKTIIIMSDGIATMAPISPDSLAAYMPSDWVSDTSTIAKNAAIAAATKAKNDNVTIYTIGFGAGAEETTLRSMATSPSYYYYAPNNAALDSVYAEIAGKIVTEAGVDTQMDVDMGTVVVNGNEMFNNATNQVLDYKYVPGISTMINRYWDTNKTPIAVADPNPNQNSTYWNINKTLHFNIGKITLNEVYQAKYRLQVLRDGNINVFGPTSKIKFLSGTTYSELDIPDTYITSSYDLTKLGINTTIEVRVTDFAVTDDESGRHIASFNQTVLRGVPTPTPSLDYIVEMNVGGMWVQIGTISLPNIATQKISFEVFGFIPQGAQLRLATNTEHMSVTPGETPFSLPPPAYTIYGKSHIILS